MVIAIIAILAAILFPVFVNARDRAKLSRCQVHLREVGVAALMYVDAHDGRFPVPRIRNQDGTVMADRSWPEGQCIGGQMGKLETGNINYSWPQHRPLNKYIKSIELFHCPSEKRQSCAGLLNTFPWIRFGSSYNMNVTFHYPGENNYFLTLVQATGSSDLEQMYTGRRISELKRPRRMIFAGERPIHAFWGKSGPNAKPDNFLGHDGEKPATPIVFCDGHVDYVFMTPGLSGSKWALAQAGWCPFAPKEGD